MATKTFDALTAVATGAGTDVVPISRGGVTMKVPLSAFGVPRATAVNLAATGLPSFDPTLLPFNSNSPWRLGISQNAVFAADNDPRNVSINNVSGAQSPYVNYYQYSHPVNVASTSDPLASVTDSYHPVGGTPAGGTWQEYIPAAAIIAVGTDKHMHVITPDKKDVIEHFGTVRVDSTHYTTTRRHRVNLYGAGLGPQNGCRAYGGPAVGGLIRNWEIDPANPNYTGRIDHPIALALISAMMLYTGTGTLPAFGGIYDENGYGQLLGYTWPATEQDGNSTTAYKGVIPMGSYFAIPPAVDVTALGLTAQGVMVAKAMQDYGAYVTDTTGTSCLYIEDAATSAEGNFASALLSNSAADMKLLFQNLKVVTSNGPSTPNGGSLSSPRRGVKPSIPGSGTVVDATTTAKGVIQLAGDLGGTAAVPTVPGLAAKAPLASPPFTGTPTKAGVALATTADLSTAITTAINALVAGAPAALDTLIEIATQLGNDETAATALTGLVNARAITSTVALTAAGTLTSSARNTLDGTGGAFTATLPAPTKVGQLLLLDRVDTSTTTTITVAAAAGATLRGNSSATFTFPGVGVAGEGALLIAESLTSWTIGGSIKPKAWLDALYAQVLEPVTAASSGTAVTLSNGVNDLTLTGNAVLTFPSLPPTGVAKTLYLKLRQDATGGRTVTWPGVVQWPGGIPPVLSSIGGKKDSFSFVSTDGVAWDGGTSGLDIR